MSLPGATAAAAYQAAAVPDWTEEVYWRDPQSPLRITFTHPPATVHLSGVIDDSTRSALTRALARAAASPGGALVIDLAGVEFCDLAGLRTIISLTGAKHLTLASLPAEAGTLLRILGWDATPGLTVHQPGPRPLNQFAPGPASTYPARDGAQAGADCASGTRQPTAPPGAGSDLIDLILADHRQIRELLDALGGSGPGCGAACSPGLSWRKLATLLELHTQAEQEIFYPAVWRFAREAAAELEEAFADHNDLVEAAQEADLQPPGSAAWWCAVAAVRRIASRHLTWEEESALAALTRTVSADIRRELGRQWTEFMAARIADVIDSALGRS